MIHVWYPHPHYDTFIFLADTLMEEEIAHFKSQIMQEIHNAKIKVERSYFIVKTFFINNCIKLIFRREASSTNSFACPSVTSCD